MRSSPASRRNTLSTFLLAALLVGVARAEDRVTYYDPAAKAEKTDSGTVEEETATGITFRGKGKGSVPRKIPSADVRRVVYGVAGIPYADFAEPFVAEARALRETKPAKREEALADVVRQYQALEEKVGENVAARRYLRYRVASLAVLRAREDGTRAEAAIKALTEYKTANPGGWEIVPALRDLARLQELTGKADDAGKTYEELAAVDGLPREMKQEADLLVGRTLLRKARYADAEKRLGPLAAAMPADDPQRPVAQAYLAASRLGQGNLSTVEADLNGALKASADDRVRGLIHNLLGDYYTKAGKDEDAFWHYLRVDALYNEDPEEQAKALFRLSDLFTKVKRDPVRSRECAARLRQERYAGTYYQNLAGGPGAGGK